MKYMLYLFLFLLPQLSWAIIDGEPITDNSFRQSVALVYKDEVYCSGTLIGPRVVATVAHCILSGAKAMKVSIETFQKETWVYVGDTQYKNARVVIHPQNDSIYSDLALIELAEDIELENPAPLYIPSEKLIGKELIHVGYGQITIDGPKGNKSLLRLPINQFTGYNGLGVGEMYVRGPGACHGDSGGSAYVADEKGNLMFVGIEYGVSNHPCGESATYFLPLTVKILEWMKSFNLPLFYK